MAVSMIEVPVFDIVFTAPTIQHTAIGPDYYQELRAVPYACKHTLCYEIGCYRYEVVILATYSTYIGRVCGVLSIHLDPLERSLKRLYPRIDMRRFAPFQEGLRN